MVAVRVVLVWRGKGCLAAKGEYMEPFPKGGLQVTCTMNCIQFWTNQASYGYK